MINVNAGRLISIFSIAYGILSINFNILDNRFPGDIFNISKIIIFAILAVLGIMSIRKVNRNKENKRLTITMIVFWFLLIVIYLLTLTISVIGVVMFLVEVGILLVPIISGFKYLSSLENV